MKVCTKCGKISDSKFCPDCGALIEEIKDVKTDDVMTGVSEEAMLGGTVRSDEVDGCSRDMSQADFYSMTYNVENVETSKAINENIESENIIDNEETKGMGFASIMSETAGENKITSKTWFVILLLFVFFPAGVFFMWKHKKFHKVVRVIASIILGINFAFWGLIIFAMLLPCDHEWEAATCIQPKTCSLCDEIEGEALGHTEGDWEIESADSVEATAEYVKSCTYCGTALDYKTEDLTTFVAGESFYLSPSEFVDRLGNYLDGITGNDLYVFDGEVDGAFACGIMKDGDKIGALLFTDGEESVFESDSDTNGCFGAVLGTVDDEDDAGNSLRVLLAHIETCDPSLDFDEAKEIGERAIANGDVTENGITYVYSIQSGGALIGVSVLN